VIEVEISAGDAVVYLHGENETSDELTRPDWWASPDLIHSDLAPADAEKVLSMPKAWRDLDLDWPKEIRQDNTGNVVVFADFKQTDDTK